MPRDVHEGEAGAVGVRPVRCPEARTRQRATVLPSQNRHARVLRVRWGNDRPSGVLVC